MSGPLTLPSFPRSKPTVLSEIPSRIFDLGPQHQLLFATMHLSTAAECYRTGVIPCLRYLISNREFIGLGYPEGIRKRVSTSLPSPYQGKVADAVGLTVTPHTLAAFGSYSPTPDSKAPLVDVGAMSVAIVALQLLLEARLPMLFVDRSPVTDGAVFSDSADLENLPWQRIRARRFSQRGGDPIEAARYEAEVLVYGSVPLTTVRMFAVHDENAAAKLRGGAAKTDRSCPRIEVRPTWFFGKR